MRITLIALLVALVSVSAAPKWYTDYRLGLAERRIEELEQYNNGLKVVVADTRQQNSELEQHLEAAVLEVERLRPMELTVEDYNSLNAQIASAENYLGEIHQSLNSAQSRLNTALGKASRIESALGSVRAIQVSCCGSMEPFIDSNDMVFVLDNPTSVGIGDVVAVVKCGLLHRIVREDSEGFVMKGDNRTNEDACRFSASDVAYKVVSVAIDVF